MKCQAVTATEDEQCYIAKVYYPPTSVNVNVTLITFCLLEVQYVLLSKETKKVYFSASSFVNYSFYRHIVNYRLCTYIHVVSMTQHSYNSHLLRAKTIT